MWFFKADPDAQLEKLAIRLQEDDPEWTYTVTYEPQGSFISIFDEIGYYVGRMDLQK
ncbi:MAG: hypothetical protein KGI54_13195 [Pseudomonadota bacterium]|nr:hypothetical protein [Pseudomonadota bacterium]